MKVQAKVSGLDVEITLTPEQIKTIGQSFKREVLTYKDIKTLEQAIAIVEGVTEKEIKEGYDLNLTPESKLDYFAKAFNKVSNKKDKFPNFIDKNQEKWYPCFELTGSGLVFRGSDFVRVGFHGAVAYFRTKGESDYAASFLLKYYQEIADQTY